ncbi:MAG TPA: alpha/beta hydrolase [Acidimicrobiales bacterium]|nr:alpha/beta hydrolase [Acidimicrobiales bacterium]
MDGARTTPGGLYAHESGEGPLVVLVHGAMDRSGGMLRTRRLLQPGHRVVRYDRRGYGRSVTAPPGGGIDRQVQDLADVLDGRPAVVVGHSFGGVVALALAERSPELVRAVAAYESPMTWEDEGAAVPLDDRAEENPDGVAEWFMRRMVGDDTWEKMPAGIRDDRRAEGRALLADLRAIEPSVPPPYRAERVTVPVVAAHGEHARTRHRTAALRLAERAPDAELVVVPGADHGVHLSNPQAFADLALRALARADARERSYGAG